MWAGRLARYTVLTTCTFEILTMPTFKKIWCIYDLCLVKFLELELIVDTLCGPHYFFADTSDFASRRKFLLENAKEGSREHDSFENEADKNQRSQNTILTPKKLAIAAPLSLIFCCAIFCPCFRARRRGSSHYVRDNDPVSGKLNHLHFLYIIKLSSTLLSILSNRD